MTDRSNHEREDVHRPQQLAHATRSTDDERSTPSFAVGLEYGERRHHAKRNQERIGRLQNVRRMRKVVVAISSVVCRSQSQKKALDIFCVCTIVSLRLERERSEKSAPIVTPVSTPSIRMEPSNMMQAHSHSSSVSSSSALKAQVCKFSMRRRRRAGVTLIGKLGLRFKRGCECSMGVLLLAVFISPKPCLPLALEDMEDRGLSTASSKGESGGDKALSSAPPVGPNSPRAKRSNEVSPCPATSDRE